MALFKDAYGELLKKNATVMSPDSRMARVGESAYDYAVRSVGVLEQYFQQHQHIRIRRSIVCPDNLRHIYLSILFRRLPELLPKQNSPMQSIQVLSFGDSARS